MEKDNKEAPDVPMVEQYKVDTIVVHAGKVVRDVKIIVSVGAALILLIVYIFVSFYSSRQREFLNTINMLLETRTTAEVQNAETMEQFAPP